jgi:Glycosyl hydrolase family 26
VARSSAGRSKRSLTGRRLSSSGGALLAVLAVLCLAAAPPGPARGAGGAQRQIGFGAYIPNSYEYPGLIDRYARLVGRRPVIVSRYPNWSTAPFTHHAMAAIWDRGAVPLVTWEPWTASEKGISLRAIAAGRYDGYARRSAREAIAWGRPILLRFAHEMNGGWYPWGTGHGYSPATYVAAWRHLVRLFRSVGATNVQWVWSPNVDEQGGFPISVPLLGSGPSHPFPFEQFFPGDRWVDWVALDGFNWGKGGKWQSFTEIFGNSYDAVIRMTSRPIIVAETASNEGPGDKGAWVASALEREIPQFQRIRAVVWFDEPFNGVDARVDSSPGALAAFRSAIDSPRYGLSRRAFLATPAVEATGGAAPSPPSDGFGRPSLAERVWYQISHREPWSIVVLAVLLAIVLAVATLALVRLARRPVEGR